MNQKLKHFSKFNDKYKVTYLLCDEALTNDSKFSIFCIKLFPFRVWWWTAIDVHIHLFFIFSSICLRATVIFLVRACSIFIIFLLHSSLAMIFIVSISWVWSEAFFDFTTSVVSSFDSSLDIPASFFLETPIRFGPPMLSTRVIK